MARSCGVAGGGAIGHYGGGMGGVTMLAIRLSRRLSRQGVHYAWVVAALTFCFTLISSTMMMVPGVLVVPIAREFGWSLGDIAAAMALRMLLFGAVAPFAGALMLRYGLTRMMGVSATLMVFGNLMAVMMTAKWELWASIGILLGIAPGMTALVVTAAVASRWFTARRGLVLGLLAAAVATGQLLFLPAAAWLSEHIGWRAALVPTAAMMALLGLLYVLLVPEYPADLGLAPYGEDEPIPRPPVASGNAVGLSFAALRDAAGVPAFWVLSFSFAVCGASSLGLMATHFVPLCADFGVTAVTAASLLALMGVCDFFGTIGSGWLSDRFDSRWLLSWYYGLRGLSLLWLPFATFSFEGLSLFAVFFGLDYVATVPPTAKIAIQAFGGERAPVVLGWIFAIHQLGAAIMAAAGGATRDALATYLPAFSAAGVVCVLAASSMLILVGSRNPAARFPAPARA
jgi:predicted MFS family arabinose efflux permease